uniref:Glycosyltransferase RgtA/B/C/D-like domain-containing protein n=1 Tax=candidate division WOR-3 bacterium TaxID=2052148 RepID=A0A7V1EIL3_UNCW3
MAKNKEFKIWLFFLIYTTLSALLFDPKLFTGGDNAVYIILAESITTGKGYKNIYLPEQPPHTQYPPGFPLLLSIPILIFGKNIILLKLMIFLTGLGSLLFFYLIIKEYFKEYSKIFTLVYLSIPIFINYNHWILSEIPFLFFSLGAIYFLLKFCHKRQLSIFLVATFFAIYAFFIRTAGISLILGFVLFSIIKKEYKYLIIFLILFLIFFIPWEMRNASIPDNTGYIKQLLAKNPYQMELGTVGFSDFMRRIWDNLLLYSFTILPSTILPILNYKFLPGLSGLIFMLFTITGFILRLKKFTILETYFIFGIGVLLAWPGVWSSDRFLLPLIPLVLIYIFSGLIWIQNRLKIKNFALVILGLLIVLNVISIIPQAKTAVSQNLDYMKGNRFAGYTIDWRRYFEVIDYIRKNIPEDRIIMARKPEFVYLLSRHKSFCYPFTTNRNEVRESIKKVDYIIFDNFRWTGTTLRYLLPVIQEHFEDFETIYKTNYPEFLLLRVKKENFSAGFLSLLQRLS